MLSGDGGWAEIDKSIAAGLSAAGVPVVAYDIPVMLLGMAILLYLRVRGMRHVFVIASHVVGLFQAQVSWIVVWSLGTRIIPFEVADQCGTPPTFDELIRSFTTVRVLPEPPCATDSLRLQIVENGCPPCVRIVGLSATSPVSAIARIEWTPVCNELACISDTPP